MANYIRIEGTEQQLLDAGALPGFMVRTRTAADMGSGVFEVKGYADDATVADIQALGATVEILRGESERNTHLAAIDTDTGDPGEGIGFA